MKRVLATLGILLVLSLPGLAIVGGALVDDGQKWGVWLVAPFVVALLAFVVWVCWGMTRRRSE